MAGELTRKVEEKVTVLNLVNLGANAGLTRGIMLGVVVGRLDGG